MIRALSHSRLVCLYDITSGAGNNRERGSALLDGVGEDGFPTKGLSVCRLEAGSAAAPTPCLVALTSFHWQEVLCYHEGWRLLSR